MAISEKLIAKYIVKPSSPTPESSKYYKRNFMDQTAPAIYIPFVFFYQSDKYKPNKHDEISQLLKESLSQILTIFYPLAGEILENSLVHCNDTGVEFAEVQVHACLAQVIEEPNMEELNQFLPVDSSSHSDNNLLLLKVSFFDCGGFSIGVCLSHKITDFSSFILFMNAWATKCRGETHVIKPFFDLAACFPPSDTTPSSFHAGDERIRANRLIFDREKLEILKQKITSSDVNNPTTVEAVSIFIWKNFIDYQKAILGGETTSFAALHVVNFRNRTTLPITNNSFGNCGTSCLAFTSRTTDSCDLLSKLRTAIRSVDDNYIKKLTMNEYFKMINEVEDLCKLGTKLCCFTSLFRCPTYDVDFGWGKPVWISTTTMRNKNMVVLISTPSGDGIEAWIGMSENYFEKLKSNYKKLLS